MSCASADIRAEATALRAAAEEDRRRAAEREAMADRLDCLAANLDTGPDWVNLDEVAATLNLSYEAAQKRVARRSVGRTVAGRVWAPRRWLDEQLDARSRG